MRVRCFTQDDAHIFMTPEQIKDEIKGVYNLIDQVYSVFGFKYHVELSTPAGKLHRHRRDVAQATDGLQGALDELGVNLRGQRGRRRLLRPQDRLPPGGQHWPYLAVRHHSSWT